MRIPTFTKVGDEDTRLRLASGGIGVGDGFYSRLLIDRDAVVELLSPCGTCGVMFRRVGETSTTLSDARAAELLGTLDDVPPDETLERLARPLQAGTYGVAVYEAVPRRVEPGRPGDFFAEHVWPLHGRSPGDDAPRQPYYRFGSDVVLEAKLGSVLGASMVMPLQDPRMLDEETVERWIDRARGGEQLTALALSILDVQGPAMWGEREANGYPHVSHRVLVHYLFDGHHRLEAASRLGQPMRVLGFLRSYGEWSRELADDEECRQCVELHRRPSVT